MSAPPTATMPATNGDGSPPNTTAAVEATFLIVGAGPAGASLACFLASHGLRGILIAAAGGTAREPRAHITNAAALECLRDIGLEEAALQQSTPPECMEHTRWCRSMAGEEFARVYSWGNQPDRKGDYDAASPCRHVDLPQTSLEPILIKYATHHGISVRFSTSFVSYERSSPTGAITSTVKDELTGLTYRIRTKYLFGCDGARSQVMRQLDIPLIKKPGQGLALNILAEMDLSKHIKTRTGNLHIIFTPELEHPPWGWNCILRMVKPWNQWMFIILPEPGFDNFTIAPTEEEYLKRMREFVGDDSIPIKILDASKWYINEIVAERYSDGNILCLGDAVHRHPPFNGLGSNTCIQDAFNLAWKVAYVEAGKADPSLLDTYSPERQPIGAGVIARANQGLRDHHAVWEALGVLPASVSERMQQHAELSAATPEGRARRIRFRHAVEYTKHEFGGVGIEMNQSYVSSAVCTSDENEQPPSRTFPKSDEVLEYAISTYPGSRLPHAWLNERVPVQHPISTVDVAGHGRFCLLTGIGGDVWKKAAEDATEKLGVEVVAYSIGWCQDYADVYGDWARKREVEEDGCVLLRPDRVVAWRSMHGQVADASQVVIEVLDKILGRAG